MRLLPIENEVILLHGYHMKVSDISIVEDRRGRDKVYFKASRTGDPVNEPIRHTGYDGGTYGHFLGWRDYSKGE